jgi:hypothetical protein
MMPKHIVYPAALFEFFLQNLTPACASVSSRRPHEFYVYRTAVFLTTILVSSKVIHGADTENWILYDSLLNLCVPHDYIYEYIIGVLKNIKYNQVSALKQAALS